MLVDLANDISMQPHASGERRTSEDSGRSAGGHFHHPSLEINGDVGVHDGPVGSDMIPVGAHIP